MNIENNKYIFCEDSYSGEGGYSSFNTNYSYLIPFPSEKDKFFQDRRKTTILENIYKPMINLFYQPISAKSMEVELKTDNKDIKNIVKQTKMIGKCNKALLDLIKFDIALFSVSTDISESGQPDLETNPTLLNVFPEFVETLIMDGLTIKEAKYKEYHHTKLVKIPVEVEYVDNLFMKITKAWADEDGKIVLDDLGESRRLRTYDGIFYGVLSKIGEELGSTPYSYDLALAQYKIYQADSDSRSTLRKAGFPQLMIKSDKKELNLIKGNNNGIQVGADEEFPEYLEPDLTGVSLGREILEEDREFIYKTWTQGLLSSNIVYNSATASAIATKSFQNTVNVYYNYYKEIVNEMINSIQFTYNINTSIDVEYPEMDINETSMKDVIEEII